MEGIKLHPHPPPPSPRERGEGINIYIYYLESFKKDLPLLPYLLIYLFNQLFIFEWNQVFVFFSFPSYNTNTIFFFKLFHRWPFQALSSWLLRPFDMIHPFFFFNAFPFILAPQMPQAHLGFSLTQDWNQAFLQGDLVLLLENDIWKPRSRCWAWLLLLEFYWFYALSKDRAGKYIHVYQPYRHTFL